MRRQDYYRKTIVVTIGTADRLVDVGAALRAAWSDGRFTPAPTRLVIETTVDLTLKINETTADEITITAASGFTLPPEAELEVSRLYFSHTGASSGSGDASVSIFAA